MAELLTSLIIFPVRLESRIVERPDDTYEERRSKKQCGERSANLWWRSDSSWSHRHRCLGCLCGSALWRGSFER